MTEQLAGTLADEHGPRLLALAQMVTRDATAAEAAVVDGVVVAAGLGGHPPQPERQREWLTALVLGECHRQLRARGQFATTRRPVSPAADPMDVLSPADREALALGLDDRAALRRWRDATVALVLVRVPDPACPGRSEIIGGAALEDGGMLTPRRLAALSRHREVCHRCTGATTPVLAGLEDRPAIAEWVELGDGTRARVSEAWGEPERVAHLVERAGPYSRDGFPIPPRDADPARWLRRAAVLAAVSAVLLLVALVVLGLTSR